jgi:repressor of nif and glnA expression
MILFQKEGFMTRPNEVSFICDSQHPTPSNVSNARLQDKVGLSISRIDVLSFQTTFNVQKKRGLVPVNISFFPKEQFARSLKIMTPVFAKNLAVSSLVALAQAGESLGDIVVPEGKTGLATVCSIVVNGVLLKHGIPIDSKFAGILQLRQGQGLRFVELIHYASSSLDPSEIFIRGRMTSIGQVVAQGDGKILANFREIPALSRSLVESVIDDFTHAGINGVLAIGDIGHPVCQTHVDMNKSGMILIGGLNPVAAVCEAGIHVDNNAMSTVMEFEQLRDIKSFDNGLPYQSNRAFPISVPLP